MALAVLADLKAYLRVTWTTEDAALTAMLARATALVTTKLNRSITSSARTFTVEDPRGSSTNVSRLSRDPVAGVVVLRVPDSPIDLAQPITLTDRDGTTLDATSYRMSSSGLIRAVGCAFWNFPYTVVATTGLATRADYATVVEPCVNAAILDIAADLYQRRNPAATAESDGAGGSVQYGRYEESIPMRALDYLAPFVRAHL